MSRLLPAAVSLVLAGALVGMTAPAAQAAGPWPAAGQGAYVLGTGDVRASPHERPAPIASLAKMMTAYLVLGPGLPKLTPKCKVTT